MQDTFIVMQVLPDWKCMFYKIDFANGAGPGQTAPSKEQSDLGLYLLLKLYCASI